jgi:hypothetical protein
MSFCLPHTCSEFAQVDHFEHVRSLQPSGDDLWIIKSGASAAYSAPPLRRSSASSWARLGGLVQGRQEKLDGGELDRSASLRPSPPPAARISGRLNAACWSAAGEP